MGEKQRILKVSDSHVPEVISTKACAQAKHSWMKKRPVHWSSDQRLRHGEVEDESK